MLKIDFYPYAIKVYIIHVEERVVYLYNNVHFFFRLVFTTL